MNYRKYTAALLEQNNLLPNQSDFEKGMEETQKKGAEVWKSLLPHLPTDWLNEVLATVNWNKKDVERILGFGASFTAYLIAPLRSDLSDSRKSILLGAIVNLIVSLYDELIDHGYAPESILPKDCFRQITNFSAWEQSLQLQSDVVIVLVKYYFEALISYASKSSYPSVLKHIFHLVESMYHAENLTLKGEAVSKQNMIDKSCLPFQVMGISIWLNQSDKGSISFEAHSDWLMKAGSFIGWLDDICDYDLDLKAAHPNLLEMAIKEGEVPLDIIHQLLDDYHEIVAFWKHNVSRSNRLPSEEAAIFELMICAWLGGVPKKRLEVLL